MLWGLTPNSIRQSEPSQVDIPFVRIGMTRCKRVLRSGVSACCSDTLLYSVKTVFIGPNQSNVETQGSWMLAFLGWKALGLALEASFLAVSEAKIASPEEFCLAKRSYRFSSASGGELSTSWQCFVFERNWNSFAVSIQWCFIVRLVAKNISTKCW